MIANNTMRPVIGRDAMLTFLLIILTMGLIVGWGFGIFSRKDAHAQAPVVPTNTNVTRLSKLPDNGPGEIEILSDLSVFDLRFWRPVPDGRANIDPVSPVNYENHLRVIKKKDVPFLYAHYATSGLRIDFQCVTHNFGVELQDSTDVHEGQKEYVVSIDVSKEPVGKEFNVLLQATYWNGFRSDLSGDASTYTDELPPVPQSLSLLVLFPSDKPLKSVSVDTSPNDKQAWAPYSNPAEVYKDAKGLYAYWEIGAKQANHHYRMTWGW
jgi:hypothetical protein